MKLTMLGTGNATARKCYNTCFVIENEGKFFLVDGGGGNTLLSRLDAAGVDPLEIRDIFVTHKHIDHLLGILWMCRIICQAMSGGKYEGEARIYAHSEVIRIIRETASVLLAANHAAFLGTRLKLVTVESNDTPEIIGCPVTFFDIGSTKDRQFGFSMALPTGGTLTCCGDEPYRECAKPYAENAGWLLHEAFCLYADRERFKPYEKHHSTVKDAAESAEDLKVKNLVLYHTVDSDLGTRKARFIEEAARYYSGNILVPDDMESIEIR